MIEEHYRKNYDKQLNILTRILDGNRYDAEDVLQEAYTRALTYLNTFEKSKGDFEKWFTSILFNCMSDFRSESRSVTKESIDKHYDLEEILSYASQPSTLRLIEKEIEKETKKDVKIILECWYLKGYTANEIRYTIGYSETKVWKVCSEFRKRLKDKYGV